jgi:hypothetical protein
MSTPEKPVRSFFKNNPFFSVDKKEDEQITPNQTVVDTTPVPQSNFPMPPPVQAPDISSDIEREYLDHFMKFMESKNFAGLDYLEFANTLHKMFEKSGSAIPEANLYELAFVSFESQGIGKDIIVNTAKQYIDLITTHKQEFDKFLVTDGSKLLQEKKEENTRLEKSNSDSSLQIAQLQQQIANIQATVVNNTQTIQANIQLIQGEEQKNNTKKHKFENAFNVVISKINGDIQKINTYLK